MPVTPRGTEDHREVRGIGDSSESLVGSDSGDIAGKKEPRTCRADAAPHDGRRPGRGQQGAGCQRRFPVTTARSLECASEPDGIAAALPAASFARRGRGGADRTRRAVPYLRRQLRSLGRHARAAALALAGLAVLALAVPETAAAQTVTTFISNAGQAGSPASSSARATAFTTGGNTGGYGLTSVDVTLSSFAITFTPRVEIFRNDATDRPGTRLATLINPATVTQIAVNTFNAPPNTTLTANTPYWLVVSNDAAADGVGIRVKTAGNATADTGAAMGWSIGNALWKNDIRNASWSTSGNRIIFAVKGTLGTTTANTAATGAPTITGTAEVGQTLTAVTTGITDANGLTSPTYTYQWIRVNGAEADISGANSSTYTLVAADLGETITVRVTFSDDIGYTETLTSEATATVVAATVAATAPTVSAVAVTSSPTSGDTYGTGEMIRFTVTFDQDVTVTGTPEFEFCLGMSGAGSCTEGSPPPTRRRAVLSSGSGTTALVFSYTVVVGDVDVDGIWIGDQDRTIKLDAGDAIRGTVSGLDAVLTHAEVGRQTGHKVNGAAANTAATGAPTITGTAQVGQTLTAVTTGITDADGLTSPTYTYQWIRVNGAEADISGAMSSTYTLLDADLGKTLTVRVRFDDDAGNTETLTSAATAVAAATAPTVSAVAVTSSPASGDTYGTGEMIRFTVTFDQDVTVTGTPEFEFCLGSSATMSCSVGTPPPALRSAAPSSGSGTTALVFSYTVVAGDMDTDGIWIGNQDRTIKLDAADAIRGTVGGLDAVLTHAEEGGQSGHKVNGETTTNTTAAGAPTITGTAQVDQTLTAVTTGIMDDDGLTSVTYTYQWIRVDGTEADIAGANSSTYTLVAADLGKTLTVRVRFDDDAGNPETLTSAATVTVTGAVMAVCAVPSLSGRTVIWTGAMTVAVDPTFAGVFGFERERFGSLDDQTFTVGANDYTTQQVSLMGNVLTFGTTNSALTPGEQAVLRLHVCAADLDFSAATVPTGDHGDLLFATTGLSWSSGSTITLRLSLPAGPRPPPPPPVTDLEQVMGVGVVPATRSWW